jgi:Flp pilus assembly pilin Flp
VPFTTVRVTSGWRLNLYCHGGGRMKNLLKLLWKEQKGQDLTEYALLLALVALGAVTTMKTIASTINSLFANAASKIGP